MRHGIDLKTHSQCQRRRPMSPRLAQIALGRIRFRFILEMVLMTAGGAYRDRTDDPLLAKQVLSQLS
jgi:hypothetical protein